MRVALVQLASAIDSTENRRVLDDRLGALGAGANDLVVLPEATMHDFGDTEHDLASAAEPLDGPFVDAIAGHARRLRSTVVAGMFEATDALPFNTLVAVGPDGDLLATYRKIHLYDSFGYAESDRMAAGDLRPVTLDVQGVRTGLMTCYDLRFPELARALVDDDATLLVCPAAWVAGERKLHHWRTLLTARAIEDTVHVAAAAQGGDRYTGHSMLIDPWGEVLTEADGTHDAVLTADVDPHVVAEARRTNPSLANRRMGGPR